MSLLYLKQLDERFENVLKFEKVKGFSIGKTIMDMDFNS